MTGKINTPDEKIYVSPVVPCCNEEAALPPFYAESVKVLSAVQTEKEFEFIFVDDGSKDRGLEVLRGLAGLQAARGEYVAMPDADLRHPPSLIPKMHEAIISGEYDCVAAIRTRKGDSRVRTFFAGCFYRLTKELSGIEIIDGAGDFRLMTRRYVAAIVSLAERGRFSKGIYPRAGFKTKWIEYENVERLAGNTKWSMSVTNRVTEQV